MWCARAYERLLPAQVCFFSRTHPRPLSSHRPFWMAVAASNGGHQPAALGSESGSSRTAPRNHAGGDSRRPLKRAYTMQPHLRHQSSVVSRRGRSERSKAAAQKLGKQAADDGHARRTSLMSNVQLSLSFAAGHLRAQDIVHVNTGSWRLDAMQGLFNGPPCIVILVAAVIYVSSTCFFAAIFFSMGAGCFKLEDQFSYGVCLWISIHVFSTIGFGNVAPRQTCAPAQLVLLVETFWSLLVVAAISGYVVKQFLRPLSAIRFSSVILLNHGRRRVMLDDEEARASDASSAAMSYRFLTFRMVRQGMVKLKDVRVQMQAQFWLAGDLAFGDRDHHKGRVVSLSLEQDYFTTLEQLQVWHRLDESSPLWRMRDNISVQLDGVEVSVSAFDTSSLQQVRPPRRPPAPRMGCTIPPACSRSAPPVPYACCTVHASSPSVKYTPRAPRRR